MALQFLNDGYFAGKVGIGAPAASKKLEVTGNAGIEGTLTVETSSNNIRLLDSNDSTVNFSVGVNGKFQIRDVSAVTNPFQIEKGAASNSLYIDEDGFVGVGTNAPTYKLVVNSGTTNVTSVFKSTDNQAWISIQDDDSGTYGALIGTDSDESENFVVANASASKMLSLNSSGSLKLHNYDGANQIGAPTYLLGTDASGNVLKVLDSGGTVTGSGTSTQVAFWDTNTSLSGDDALWWDSINNRLGIGDNTPSARLKVATSTSETSIYTVDINHVRNDADVGTHAMRINMDLSGADTTTADRLSSGIYIDIDSSANGDASNEHRIYGVNSAVNFTGFSDIVRGGWFFAESNYTGAKTAQLAGVYGQATHDSSSTDGGVSNMYGVYGTSSVQDLGDVDNAFGGYFSVTINTNRGAADVGVTKAVEGEIAIDKDVAINYGTMIGISSIIDNNEGSVPNFGNQYLFKGDYQGTRGGNAYGIYCDGDKHYLEGNVGIGVTAPDHKLQVSTPALVSGSTYSWPFDLTRVGSTSRGFSIGVGVAGGNVALGNHNGDMALGQTFGVDSNNLPMFYETMRISHDGTASSGNVGIGTTSPGTKLDVSGQIRSNDSFLLQSGTTAIGSIRNQGGALDIRGDSTRDVSLGSVTSPQALFIEGTNGNVGIGTVSPTSLLEISQQLSAAATIDYPYTISSRDDANSINQVGGEGVGIKFRIAGNAATTPGNSLVGASIAAIREEASDTDSSTGLGFFVTQNDETLDEALRIDHDRNIKFNAYGIGTLVSDTDGNITVSSGGGQGGPYLKDTTDTFTGALTIVGDIRGSGQQLILNAGESYNYATAQASELVYLNAEAGLQVNSSPDNWATGWAGRNTAFINRADASSSLPGNLSIAAGSQLFLDGGGNTYISEDIADRLRFFVGGAEFMRFTEDTADTVTIYKDTTFTGNITGVTETLTGTESLMLTLNPTANNYGGIWFKYGGVSKGMSIYNSGDMIYGGESGVGTKLQTNGQTALTIDTSQNSTFSNAIIVNGNITSQTTGGAALNLRRDDTSISGTNTLGSIAFQGDDPVDGTFNNGAIIFGKADGSWASGSYPGQLLFQTRNTSGSLATALTLAKNQNATFSTQAFATTATSSGDATSTLTTKGYVDSLITGATIYRGTWDPSGGGYGSPDLSGVTQTSGYYYICSAAGTAEPNGTGCEPDSWETGDWVIWNDDIVDCAGTGTGGWQKIDNSSVLSGVGTGQTVALWQGASSVTDSETLGNAPITVSGNDTTFAGTIDSGNIFIDNSGTPQLKITDSGNGGGGGASGKIIYANTAGNAIGLGYTSDLMSDSDFIISTDASSTYGGYLGLDSAAILDPSDIILDPKTNVYITKFLGIGTASPLDLLHIKSSTTDARQVIDGHTGFDAELKFAESGTVKYTVGHDAATENFVIGTANVDTEQRLVINSSGNVGIGITAPTSKLHINQSVTDPDLDIPISFAVEIDSNHSGSAATTGDREQGGLYIDVDSSTTGGDTSDEHRVYGIYSDVRHSGDSDRATGVYSIAEQNTTTGATTYVLGGEFVGVTDGGANATLNTVAGVWGSASIQDATPLINSYGGYFKNGQSTNRTGSTTSTYGLYTEVELNSDSTYTNIYGQRITLDVNTSGFTASKITLLDFSVTGLTDIPSATNTYAIHQPSDIKSYHEGDFGIGTTTPDGKLEVSSNSSLSSYVTQYTNDTDGAELVIRTARGTQSSPVRYNTNDSAGRLLFQAYTSSNQFEDAASIESVMESGYANAYGGLRFNYMPAASPYVLTEGMRLNKDGEILIPGDVGIGTTNPSSKLQVAGGIQMADDTDTASATKVGTMRYRTGTEYVDVTGVEEVTNGSFTTDADWNKNANWTISGGTANADGTSNADMNQIPVNGYPAVGEVFRVSFEITASTQGQVRIEYGDATTDFVSAINQYEYILTAVSTDRIRIQCQNSFIGSVDNLSIVEVTAEDASYADMCMQTGASTYEWVNIVRNTY